MSKIEIENMKLYVKLFLYSNRIQINMIVLSPLVQNVLLLIWKKQKLNLFMELH